jgi:parvulin-like peptidyl-prolyl isomerase
VSVQTQDKKRPTGRDQARQTPGTGQRQTAVHYGVRRDGAPLAFGWGANLTRIEKDRIKARLLLLGLSSVLALVVLLIGGAFFWEKVIVTQRPVLRMDGQTVSLGHYAALLSYRRTILESEMMQLAELANQPTPAGVDPSQNVMAMYARQRLQQIQSQLVVLDSRLLEDLIEERLIRAEAAKRGIAITPAQIESELKLMVGYQEPAPVESGVATPAPAAPARGSSSFEARYRDYRRATGASDALIRSDVEYSLIRREIGKQLGEAVPARSDQIKSKHILVAEEEAAKQALERIRGGESFEAVAAEVSIDPGTKDQGGELGWFSRGMLVTEFEDAAYSLQPGQISEPVKTSFGWHLIFLEERDPNRALEGSALEAAKERALPNWLEEEKQKHTIQRLLDDDMIDWAYNQAPRTPARGRR